MNRYNSTNTVGIIGVIANIFLLIIKLIVGTIAKSEAMIADAFNSAGDIFASLMTTIGSKIANIPKDEDHNFGHGKAEYIFSMFISLSMIFISLKLIYDCIISIINKNVVIFNIQLIIVCIITILIKLILYLYTKKIYIKNKNLLLKSNMIDHRNDCFLTLMTTLSIVLSKFGISYVDGIVGILISLCILISGIKIFIESYNVLMDISIDNGTKKEVLNIIKEYDEVKKVDELYYVPTGYKYVLVFTIFVDGEMSTNESHMIADNLENKIINNINKIDKVIIHVNPI